MKGESRRPAGTGGRFSASEAEAVAIDVLNAIVREPESLGRFLAASGLDPATIRTAAAGPGFLAAVLDHVAGDERMLVEIAGALGIPPERIMRARSVLSPEVEWSP